MESTTSNPCVELEFISNNSLSPCEPYKQNF